MFCSPPGDSNVLRVVDIELVQAGDFDVQTDYHVALADSVRPELIKRAWDTDSIIVEAHSHVDGDPAKFSRSDLWGFGDWVPHMLWRLSRPYAALVFAPETFDALVWTERTEGPMPLERILVEGGATYTPTNLTARQLRAPRK